MEISLRRKIYECNRHDWLGLVTKIGGGVEDEDGAWGGDESGCGGLFCVADGGGLAALESAEGDGAVRQGVGFRE